MYGVHGFVDMHGSEVGSWVMVVSALKGLSRPLAFFAVSSMSSLFFLTLFPSPLFVVEFGPPLYAPSRNSLLFFCISLFSAIREVPPEKESPPFNGSEHLLSEGMDGGLVKWD